MSWREISEYFKQASKMEHPDNVNRQLSLQPFRPFWLETIGGTRLRVIRAEWFHEVPRTKGRIIISDENGTTITYWKDLTDTVQIDDI